MTLYLDFFEVFSRKVDLKVSNMVQAKEILREKRMQMMVLQQQKYSQNKIAAILDISTSVVLRG